MIKQFFRLPWFVYMLFALLALAAGAYMFQSTKSLNGHRAAALAGELPALIDVKDVTKSSFTAAEEINVSSQISNSIYTVSVSGRRTQDKSKTAIFALPSDASSNSGTINVVYMLEPRDSVETFVSTFATEQSGPQSTILNVNGSKYAPGRKLGKSVKQAASQSNLQLSSNVVYVEPFIKGRQKGLAPDSPMVYFATSAVVAVIFAFIGLVKFLMGMRRKKKLALATA